MVRENRLYLWMHDWIEYVISEPDTKHYDRHFFFFFFYILRLFSKHTPDKCMLQVVLLSLQRKSNCFYKYLITSEKQKLLGYLMSTQKRIISGTGQDFILNVTRAL